MDSKQLGIRIREAREGMGMSQEDLAAAVGKDQGSISEYESGKRRLSAIDLPGFAKALRVSLLYFYEGAVHESDVDHLLLAEFRQLPTLEAKHAVIDVVRILTSRFGSFSRTNTS